VIALDTNVLARYLLADDARQSAAARRFIEQASEDLWIPVSVLLELGWVLRGAGVPRAMAASKLRELSSLPGVRVQHFDRVVQAIAWCEQGMDLADAVHLALSADASKFVTFDEALIARSERLPTRPQASPP
jgi:predicted nucleic-acid-binding protein